MAISRIGSINPYRFSPNILYSQRHTGGSSPRSSNGIKMGADVGIGGFQTVSTQFEMKGMSSASGIGIGHALVINVPDKFSDFPRVDLLEEASSTGTAIEMLIERRTKAFSLAFDTVTGNMRNSDIGAAFTIMLMDAKRLCLEQMQDVRNPISAVEALENQYKTLEPLRDAPDAHFQRIPDDCFDVFLSVLRAMHGKSVDLEEAVNTSPFDDVVVVANSIPYDSASILFHHKVKGSIREKGSPGDHVSIETGTASKVGLVRVPGATSRIPNGAQLIIDGDKGNVIVNPEKKTLIFFTGKVERNATIYGKLERFRRKPAPLSTNANCDNPEETVNAISQGAKGVGLVRTERFFANDPHNHWLRMAAPGLEEQIEFYNSMISAARGKPVIFRTIDLTNRPDAEDKLFAYIDGMGDVQEGTSGINLCLDPSMPLHSIFRNQLEAFWLSKARQVMFPMVRDAESYYKAVAIARSVKKMLRGRATNPNLRFGIMVENPVLYKDLSELARKNSSIFFSIGSNDLSSLVTMNDRYSGSSAEQFNVCQFDQRVFAKIKEAVDIAKSAEREISLCGKLSNDWRGVLVLHGLGMNKLSFSNAKAADLARFITMHTKRAQIKPMISQIWNMRSPEAVIQMIESFTRDQIRSGVWKDLKPVYPLLFDEIL